MPETDIPDEQDQSEVFDETHLDDEGDGDILPDEADPVLDVTQMDGDADEEEFDEDDLDIEDEQGLAGIEREADALLGVDGERRNSIDEESRSDGAPEEVELVYTGLMRTVQGAQASAAHWEAKRLSDDDIETLGYGAPDDEPGPRAA